MTALPHDMIAGDWLGNTLREAWTDFTPILAVACVIALVLHRRTGDGGRMRGTLILLALHVLSLPVLGILAAYRPAAYINVRLVSLAVMAVIAINVSLVIIVNGILRWLAYRPPRIVIDIVAGAAYIVAAFVLLSYRGVHLSGLIATSAVLTAVIGFALQDTLSNLIGGVALQLEQSIHPGDWIQFGEHVGAIREIRWRQTTIETRAWETIIIPNNLLAKSEIVVLGRRRGRPLQWRREIRFEVDYRYEPTAVIRTCVEALTHAPIPRVAQTPPPHCVLVDVEGSVAEYAVRYWLTDLDADVPADSEVRTRLFFALRRANIPLAIEAQTVFLTHESEERKLRKTRERLAAGSEALHEINLFGALSEEEFDELAGKVRYTPFAAGETLTVQGAEGNDLYLLRSGRVAVRVAASGVEREVATLGPGAFFGERSLMTGEPRSATTVAVTDVVAYRLAKCDIEPLLEKRPELASEIAEILARRQVELESVREGMASANVRCIESEANQILSKIKYFFRL